MFKGYALTFLGYAKRKVVTNQANYAKKQQLLLAQVMKKNT
jgi:hypothetical protein